MSEQKTIKVHAGLFAGDTVDISVLRPGERSYSFDIATDTKPEKEGGRVVINVRVAYHSGRTNRYYLGLSRDEIGIVGGFDYRSTELFGHSVGRSLEAVSRYNAKNLAQWFELAPQTRMFADLLRELVAKCNLDVPGLLPLPEEAVAA